jgi:PAS domain S-box-containing protein
MADQEDYISGLDEILFKENPNPILRINKEGKVILFNKASEKLLKDIASSGKIVSGQWIKEINEALISGSDRKTEIETEGICFLVSFVPSAGRNFADVFATDITGLKSPISQNITERKKAEHTIIQNEKFLRQVIDDLPYLIFVKDSQGKYIFVNKAMVMLSNISQENIIGKSDFDLFGQKSVAENCQLSDRKVIDTKQEISEEEVFINNEGQKFWFYTIKKPLISENGDTYILGITINITERKKALEEVLIAKGISEESIKAKENFISIMSHEIRTPINAVVGITNLLLRETARPEQNELLRGLKVSSENLLKIVNNILDLSKIEAGKLILENLDFCVKDVVQSVKETYVYNAAEKNISINIYIEPNVPLFVKGDSLRLQQILMNLISNAVKFTEEGKVDIRVKSLDTNANKTHLIFSISDTGMGIPQESLSAIFESFTQADPGISKKYGGTGLGLTIAKKLIELQKGSITVKSKLNHGSEFIFDLEFEKSNVTSRIPEKETGKIRFDGIKVLIVEDQVMNKMIMVRLLENANMAIKVAANGREAICFMENEEFDLILMDLQMPEIDGYQASLHIRNKLKNKKIPIIALTAFADSDIEDKIKAAGINDYVTKPFDPSFLLKKIEDNLGLNNKANYIPEQKSATVMEPTKIIDLTYLQEASGNNKNFLKEMIGIFLTQTPDLIASLHKTSKAEDWVEFRKIMHKLKPTITMMGIHKLEPEVVNIDNAVKKGIEIEKLPAMLERFENLCNQAYLELKAELKSL